MKNVSIRAKITALIAMMVLGLAILVVTVYVSTPERLEASDYAVVVENKDLVADILPPPLYAIEALSVAYEASAEGGQANLPELKARWKQLEADHTARQTFWTDKLPPGGLRTGLLDGAYRPARKLFDLGTDQLFPALFAGDAAKAQATLAQIKAAYSQHRTQIDEVVKLANARGDAEVAEAASDIRWRTIELAILGLVLAVVGGLGGVFISRDVTRRLRATSDVLEGVASGDFSQRMHSDARDEIGGMAASLDRMLDEVERALTDVRRVAETVANASKQLSAQSENLSSGAQQQASSLEETAASLEEITATVKQSSGNAQQASQLAMSSRDVAQEGGVVVGQAVTAMNEITAASRKIGDIITAIDEIALQTNLLSLNAAVEAARAGEQGRGFAVVASEVGNLAQRSAAAAKEVKGLIEDTLVRVETGHKLVEQSGHTLAGIITSVKKVTDFVGEIAAAAREQAAGVDQVNQAVTQMDQVTQGNAGQTEQLARTAEGLSSSAEQLRMLVERFRLRGAAPATAPAVAPVAVVAPAPGAAPPLAKPPGNGRGTASFAAVPPAQGEWQVDGAAPTVGAPAGRGDFDSV